MNTSSVLEQPKDCESLYNCWKFSLLYAWSGDFGPNMKQGLNNQWLFYYLFDLAIRFVLLNVVRGITVDTFSELRLAKLERLKDTQEICFICGINKQVFDRDKISKGFKHHIKNEQNMWNYLYFIIYIWEQDKDDDDGLEQYVRRCIDVNDITWMPSHVSLCLSTNGQDDTNTTQLMFHKNINKLENNFMHRISDIQQELQSNLIGIKSIINTNEIEINTGREYTDIIEYSSSEISDIDDKNIIDLNPSHEQEEEEEEEEQILRPSTTPHQSSNSLGLFAPIPFKKSHTLNNLMNNSSNNLNNINSMILMEINEITGLSYSSRVLDTIGCTIRFGNTSNGSTSTTTTNTATTNNNIINNNKKSTNNLVGNNKENIYKLKNSTIIFNEKNESTILFDPTSLIITEKYQHKYHKNNQILIQITYENSSKYLGSVVIPFSDLVKNNNNKVNYKFHCNVNNKICYGVLTLHSTIKDCIEFN